MTATEITEGPIVELSKKIDYVCGPYSTKVVRDSILNIMTWYIGDACMQNHINPKDVIDEIAKSLHHTVSIYIKKNSN